MAPIIKGDRGFLENIIEYRIHFCICQEIQVAQQLVEMRRGKSYPQFYMTGVQNPQSNAPCSNYFVGG